MPLNAMRKEAVSQLRHALCCIAEPFEDQEGQGCH